MRAIQRRCQNSWQCVRFLQQAVREPPAPPPPAPASPSSTPINHDNPRIGPLKVLHMDHQSVLEQVKLFARDRGLPVIPIRAQDVTILNDPDSFYRLILSKTSACKQRLALSALYLGTGAKEKAIVQEICHNLATRDNHHQDELSVHLVLDAHRATRKDSSGVSSLTALEKLLPYKSVRLSLVETRSYNSQLDRFMRRFEKWNELSSTYHAKFLVFDNDVMVTGANLSDIYFENRQDRYMLIRNSKLLSDWVSNLLDVFDSSSADTRGQAAQFVAQLRRLNQQYVASLESASSKLSASDDIAAADSYIIPLVQLGSLGLKDKEDFLLFLNSILPPEAQNHLSSGYFNPSRAIDAMSFDSVLAPSEQSNGFFGGGGLLKYVPHLYSVLHQHYLDHHQGCKLFHYNRAGWSFHAKGIWVSGLGDLYIHLIGSSNFNHRSSRRDLETELVLLTRDKDLSRKLELERQRLWSESNQTNFTGAFNPIYTFVAKAVKSFL